MNKKNRKIPIFLYNYFISLSSLSYIFPYLPFCPISTKSQYSHIPRPNPQIPSQPFPSSFLSYLYQIPIPKSHLSPPNSQIPSQPFPSSFLSYLYQIPIPKSHLSRSLLPFFPILYN